MITTSPPVRVTAVGYHSVGMKPSCELRVASSEAAPATRHTELATLLTEASPLPTFDTAAGCLLGERDVSDDIWDAYRGDVLYMRALAADGRVLRTWTRHKIPS
jgi:hypothetical protein